MKVSITTEAASFTVRLSNSMTVTIYDAGHGPYSLDGQAGITVRQAPRDLLNGAPSGPDVPRYDPGGEYELALPDAVTIADQCTERDHDPGALDYPPAGVAAIAVRHIHN